MPMQTPHSFCWRALNTATERAYALDGTVLRRLTGSFCCLCSVRAVAVKAGRGLTIDTCGDLDRVAWQAARVAGHAVVVRQPLFLENTIPRSCSSRLTDAVGGCLRK